jgi:hypothetical protein
LGLYAGVGDGVCPGRLAADSAAVRLPSTSLLGLWCACPRRRRRRVIDGRIHFSHLHFQLLENVSVPFVTPNNTRRRYACTTTCGDDP